MEEIKLGDKVKDKVTGYTGMVVIISKFLNGCTQCEVQAKCGKDNKIPETIGIDIQNLELIKSKKVKKKKDDGPGGRNSKPIKLRGY